MDFFFGKICICILASFCKNLGRAAIKGRVGNELPWDHKHFTYTHTHTVVHAGGAGDLTHNMT